MDRIDKLISDLAPSVTGTLKRICRGNDLMAWVSADIPGWKKFGS
jgi:hypothetical protein